MDAKLANIASLAQKDKGPAYLNLVNEVLSGPNPAGIAPDVHVLVEAVLQDNVVIGRQILSELATRLSEGVVKAADVKKQIVEDTLATVQPRLVSYEEQVSGS